MHERLRPKFGSLITVYSHRNLNYIGRQSIWIYFWHLKQNSTSCNFIKITFVQVVFLDYRNNNNQAIFWVPSMGNTDALPVCKCLLHKRSRFVQSVMLINKGHCRCSDLEPALDQTIKLAVLKNNLLGLFCYKVTVVLHH